MKPGDRVEFLDPRRGEWLPAVVDFIPASETYLVRVDGEDIKRQTGPENLRKAGT